MNPFAPGDFAADSLVALGGSSIFTLYDLLGDRVMDFLSDRGTADHAADELWPPVRRLYEYYLSEGWTGFDRTITRSFSDWNLPRGTTLPERIVQAHQPALALTSALVTPGQPVTQFHERFMRKHVAAATRPTYLSLLESDEAAGKIRALQRSVFDVIELFVNRREAWLIGALPRFIDPQRLPDLERLTLARDEFSETRDLFQQAFEVISKTLVYPIAAQNTIKRGHPGDFGKAHPTLVPVRSRPTSLAKYQQLANAYKIAYAAEVPGWEGFTSILDNRVRNTIGHASVRHDLRSGRVVSGSDATSVDYMTFLRGVYDLFDALAATLQVLRSVRITATRRPTSGPATASGTATGAGNEPPDIQPSP
ncbi:hypothetical protein ROT00_03930 [Agromyces mediolanus]|uniref:hypothetical protein n=1 Tax=Agromyces mediolanus TaxID=41986 RepID=UPI003837DA2A